MTQYRLSFSIIHFTNHSMNYFRLQAIELRLSLRRFVTIPWTPAPSLPLKPSLIEMELQTRPMVITTTTAVAPMVDATANLAIELPAKSSLSPPLWPSAS